MDIDFNRFLYTRMAGLMVAMVAMVVMVVTAGRSVTVETGMEVLQRHNWGGKCGERFGPDSSTVSLVRSLSETLKNRKN